MGRLHNDLPLLISPTVAGAHTHFSPSLSLKPNGLLVSLPIAHDESDSRRTDNAHLGYNH
jgi:hypothetical protein